METFFALLALCGGNSPVIGEFPSQRSVTRSFDVSFDLRLNKQFSKHSRRRWFDTPSSSLWRRSNATINSNSYQAAVNVIVFHETSNRTALKFRRSIAMRSVLTKLPFHPDGSNNKSTKPASDITQILCSTENHSIWSNIFRYCPTKVSGFRLLSEARNIRPFVPLPRKQTWNHWGLVTPYGVLEHDLLLIGPVRKNFSEMWIEI